MGQYLPLQLLPKMLLIAWVFFTMAGQLLAINPFSHIPDKHSRLLLPGQDPFYKPDNSSWELFPPGTILKPRPVDINPAYANLSYIESAHQFLYRTSNAHGCPSYAVTTILLPFNANADKFLSYQIAYDSADNNCSPSYWVQDGVPPNPYNLFRDTGSLVYMFLAQGIPINIPDYEGVNATFSVGTESGYTVLDSLRAVKNSGSTTGLSPVARAAMVGYSGGAIASEWASELHSVYAPDVQILGAAMGGMPTNITKSFFAVDGTDDAGLIVASFNGISNTFPCFAAYISRHLRSEYAERFYSAKLQCSGGVRDAPEGGHSTHSNASAYFDNGNAIVYDQATLLNAIGTMGLRGIPDFPLYIWKGTRDELAVPIDDTDSLVNLYCERGTNITYVRVKNGNHLQAKKAGLPGAEAFLQAVFKGEALDRCTNTTIPVLGPGL